MDDEDHKLIEMAFGKNVDEHKIWISNIKKGIYGACCNKTRQSEHFIMWHKWEADYDVAVKLISVTDDVLKSNNGAHS